MFDKDSDGLVDKDEALQAFRRICGTTVEVPRLTFTKRFECYAARAGSPLGDFAAFAQACEDASQLMRSNSNWQSVEEDTQLEEDRCVARKQREMKRQATSDLFQILGIEKTQDIKDAEDRKQEALQRQRSQSLGKLRATCQDVITCQRVVKRLGHARSAALLQRSTVEGSHPRRERKSLTVLEPLSGVPMSSSSSREVPWTIDLPSDIREMKFRGYGSACFALRFSPDSSRLAGGYFDGCVRVFDVQRRCQVHTLNLARPNGFKMEKDEVDEYGDPVKHFNLKSTEKAAVTNLRWMPSSYQSIVATTDIEGSVGFWDLRRGREPKMVSRIQGTSELNAVSFTGDGRQLIVGGQDRKLLVYDVKLGVATFTGMELGRHMSGTGRVAGHALKVTSIAADPSRPDICVSGGLDKQVLLWDFRAGTSPVAFVRGTQLAGDALDMSHDGSLLLCGSHRAENALQVFDLRSLPAPTLNDSQRIQELSNVPSLPALGAGGRRHSGAGLEPLPAMPVVGEWHTTGEAARPSSASSSGSTHAPENPSLLFSASWDLHTNGTIVAAGEKPGMGYVYRRPESGMRAPLTVLTTVDGKGRAIYSAAVSSDAQSAAFGSVDGSVRICDLSSASRGGGGGAAAASLRSQVGGA